MPFLGFLGNLLSGPGATGLTQGMAGYMQGQQQADAARRQDQLTLLTLLRQQQQDAQTTQYRQAQVADMKARASREEAAATAATAKTQRDATRDANFFDLTKRKGWLPEGTPDSARDVGGWEDYYKDVSKATSAKEVAQIGADRALKVANVSAGATVEAAKIRASSSTAGQPSYSPTGNVDPQGNAELIDKHSGRIYITGPDGTPVPATGARPKQPGGGTGAASTAGRAAQFGTQLNVATDVLMLKDQLGKKGVAFGTPTAQDIASGHSKIAQEIPFASELAQRYVNWKDPTYSQYQAALPTWILPAIHTISGSARVSNEQAAYVGRAITYSPSDPPNVQKQKEANFIDFMNAGRASLPPEMVDKMERGISPAKLKYLKSKGYGGAPTGAALGVIRDAGINLDDTGGAPAAAPQPNDPFTTMYNNAIREGRSKQPTP